MKLLLLLLIPIQLFPQAFTTDILSMEQSTRYDALGGKQVGILSEFGFYNPAINSLLNNTFLYVSHSSMFDNQIINENITFSYSDFSISALLSYGKNIPITSLPDTTQPPSPTNRPFIISTENHYNIATFISYSKILRENLSAGLQIKGNYQKLTSIDGLGVGGDLGLFYRPLSSLSLGLKVENALPYFVRWSSGTNQWGYPSALFGVGYSYPIAKIDFLTAGTFEYLFYEKEYGYYLGLEAEWNNLLYMRAGVQSSGFRLGSGIEIGKFGVDISYNGNRELESSYKLGIFFRP